MGWSLVLLILMGQCLFLVCPLHVYHFIKEPKTWKEAQRYCKEHFADLATVYDMNDTQRLSELLKTGEAWIGLYHNNSQDNRACHWSRPGGEVTGEFWDDSQPNDNDGDFENSVAIKNKKLHGNKCREKRAFICYDEKPSGKKYTIHNGWKTWSEAQKHCREKHTDLVSGLHQLQDKNLTSEMQNHKPRYNFYWIGLFTDSWRWSDGSNASFRNWKSFKDDNSEKCAVTLLPSQKWDSRDCDQKKPFFCYKDHDNKVV